MSLKSLFTPAAEFLSRLFGVRSASGCHDNRGQQVKYEKLCWTHGMCFQVLWCSNDHCLALWVLQAQCFDKVAKLVLLLMKSDDDFGHVMCERQSMFTF